MLLHIELRKAIARHLLQDDALSALMNGPIRAKLGSTIPANVTWGGKLVTIYDVVAVIIRYFSYIECGVEVVL